MEGKDSGVDVAGNKGCQSVGAESDSANPSDNSAIERLIEQLAEDLTDYTISKRRNKTASLEVRSRLYHQWMKTVGGLESMAGKPVGSNI